MARPVRTTAATGRPLPRRREAGACRATCPAGSAPASTGRDSPDLSAFGMSERVLRGNAASNEPWIPAPSRGRRSADARPSFRDSTGIRPVSRLEYGVHPPGRDIFAMRGSFRGIAPRNRRRRDAPPWDVRRKRDSWPAPIRCFLRGKEAPRNDPRSRKRRMTRSGQTRPSPARILSESLAVEGGATEHEKVHERAHDLGASPHFFFTMTPKIPL